MNQYFTAAVNHSWIHCKASSLGDWFISKLNGIPRCTWASHLQPQTTGGDTDSRLTGCLLSTTALTKLHHRWRPGPSHQRVTWFNQDQKIVRQINRVLLCGSAHSRTITRQFRFRRPSPEVKSGFLFTQADHVSSMWDIQIITRTSDQLQEKKKKKFSSYCVDNNTGRRWWAICFQTGEEEEAWKSVSRPSPTSFSLSLSITTPRTETTASPPCRGRQPQTGLTPSPSSPSSSSSSSSLSCCCCCCCSKSSPCQTSSPPSSSNP